VTATKLHALVVGVNVFEDPLIRGLRFARRDAETMASLLEGRIPSGERRVRKLLDAQATRRNVVKAMDDLCRDVDDGDIVLIYFATHGSPEKRSPVECESAFLILHDTEYAYIHATGIDMELQIVDWGRRLEKASLVVFLLDTCFSGKAGGRTFERRKLGEESLDPPVSLQKLTLGEGRVILTAADKDEVALECDEHEHGIFTHHLLEALQPMRGDRATIGVGRLYEEVAEAVVQSTKGCQRPILNGYSNLAALPLFPRA
jgi:uncharacterized caspase-like protein